MPGHRAVPTTPWSPTTRQGRTGTEKITNIGNFTATGTGTPSFFFQDLVIQRNLIVRGGASTIPSLTIGAGAGSGASVSFPDPVNINDMLMAQIQLVTGTSPSASSTLFTITFGATYHEILNDSIYAFIMPNDSITGPLGMWGISSGGSLVASMSFEAKTAPAAATTYNFGVLVLSK